MISCWTSSESNAECSRRSILAGMPAANLNHTSDMIEAVSIDASRGCRFKNLTGLKFNHLRVISLSHRKSFPSGRKHLFWNCQCDCGMSCQASSVALVCGGKKSCGCIRPESTRKSNSTHGQSHTETYAIWLAMRKRSTYRAKGRERDFYFGRGIFCCDRWLTYENFLKDMGARPSALYSIERIDNNGPYSPSNCKWGTRKEQSRNTRKNVLVEAFGKTQTVSAWAEDTGIKYATVYARIITSGWPPERALTQSVRSCVR